MTAAEHLAQDIDLEAACLDQYRPGWGWRVHLLTLMPTDTDWMLARFMRAAHETDAAMNLWTQAIVHRRMTATTERRRHEQPLGHSPRPAVVVAAAGHGHPSTPDAGRVAAGAATGAAS